MTSAARVLILVALLPGGTRAQQMPAGEAQGAFSATSGSAIGNRSGHAHGTKAESARRRANGDPT